MKVFVEKIKNDVMRLYNGSGSDIDQYEFTVLNGFAAIALEDVVSTDSGGFEVEEGIQVQSDDLEAGEDTFATRGQIVYFNPTGDTFSDTLTAGYYGVGILTQVKDTLGVIVFDKYRYADLIESDET